MGIFPGAGTGGWVGEGSPLVHAIQAIAEAIGLQLKPRNASNECREPVSHSHDVRAHCALQRRREAWPVDEADATDSALLFHTRCFISLTRVGGVKGGG